MDGLCHAAARLSIGLTQQRRNRPDGEEEGDRPVYACCTADADIRFMRLAAHITKSG